MNNEWKVEYKINGIYSLCRDYLEINEKLTKGTPLKIISKNYFGIFFVCEDYKGNRHYISPEYIDSKEINNYPNIFVIISNRCQNTLCQLNQDLASYHIVLIEVIAYFVFALTAKTVTNFCLTALTFGNIIMLTLLFGPLLIDSLNFNYNPLYTKNNLKQLKILINQNKE